MDVFVVAKARRGKHWYLIGIIPRFDPREGWSFSAVMRHEMSARWLFMGIDEHVCQGDVLWDLDVAIDGDEFGFEEVTWFISREVPND